MASRPRKQPAPDPSTADTDGTTTAALAESPVEIELPGTNEPPSIDVAGLHIEARGGANLIVSSGETADLLAVDGAEPRNRPAVWASETIEYLYDRESRELLGATVRIRWDDGHSYQHYSAKIRRDGRNTWAWWEGERYLGNHQPDIGTVVNRALTRGRAAIGAPT